MRRGSAAGRAQRSEPERRRLSVVKPCREALGCPALGSSDLTLSARQMKLQHIAKRPPFMTARCAMIERLVHHAEILALRGDSHRLRHRDLARPLATTAD